MNPCPVLTALARALLEPGDFERMALPAIADAALLKPAAGAWGWRVGVAWQLLRIVGLSCAWRWLDAIRATRWWLLLCCALAGVAGCIGLQHSAPSLAWRHAAFLGLGLVAGAAVATLPRPLVRAAAWLSALLAAGALACVPLWGQSFDGARRWLGLGPLVIHVSTLAVPVFAAAVAWCSAKSRPWALVLVALAAWGALVAQPDPASAIVYAAVAVAACRSTAMRAMLGAAGAAACWLAFARCPPVQPVLHVEHAPALLARHGPIWFAIAMCALAAIAVFCLVIWSRARASEQRSGAAAASMALLCLMVVPWAVGDGGVPWISFGGSAAVAAFVLCGLLMRAERQLRAAS